MANDENRQRYDEFCRYLCVGKLVGTGVACSISADSEPLGGAVESGADVIYKWHITHVCNMLFYTRDYLVTELFYPILNLQVIIFED